ncbi:MAG: outer membrane protein assembly factor BamA [Proteobacteria bacterium]|uniref:Outer membrane protein assembly factor BamA n=1 Tax=Candidatus Enterousia avistercoris TaxID=2840788 RepID=A0A9D9GV22_9PROT|nr:outer membrane protein assembly factor BamA [Candidatus Enterousia avistercoris]
MNRKKIFLATAAIIAAQGANAATVSRIDVNGNQRMDAESVRILSDVKVGDNVGAERTNQIAKKLQESGYFSSVNVRMAGNVLKIDITEAPTVNMVTIEGNDEVDTDDLKKELRLKARSSYDESVIGADVQRMLTIYQRNGFFGTKIEPKKIDLGDNRVNVVYEITEGHPTYITDIDFQGNKKFSDRTLRGEILSREHAWWRFMTQFDVFDEDRILYDQQMLRQFYMRNGYVDVQITDANGVFTPDRQYYSVVFTIDEGEKYNFGEIKIENPFQDVPDDELYDVVAFDTGDVYNIDLVDETISKMRGAVADHGYAFINVEPVPTKNDENHTIDMVFKIQKTNRIYLNNINILGNVRTFDSVIEQLIPMRSGDPFSLQTIEQGRQNLMRTRYFKDVQMVPNRIADANMMNLDIQVEEQPTGELSGGFGWSNINGFMVDAGITENNFMGRGQIVQLRGSIAQYQKQALFSFTEPYLFGRPLSAGFDVSYTMYDYSSLGGFGYDRDSLTVAGRMGWKLTDHWSQTVRLSASFDQNYDIQSETGWRDANLYTLGTYLRYYNLDTNFEQNTHTGVVGNIGVAYTGFGGTETYMRYSADIIGMVKFWDNRWQLRSSLEFGALQAIGDSYISRVYRYFLGGETLRGFDIAGVGSRNWAYTTYSLGGLWKLNGSTQLNFPIFIPDEYQIKGFVFFDYGILGKPPKEEYTFYGYPNKIDSDLRTSVGVGIYWNTPMGPMNFSWGWPLKMNKYDREQRFLLSFETQF